MKTITVCNSCGSPRVWFDAFVSINDPTNIQTYDYTHCEHCEGECTTTTAEVPDDFDMEGGFVWLK